MSEETIGGIDYSYHIAGPETVEQAMFGQTC